MTKNNNRSNHRSELPTDDDEAVSELLDFGFTKEEAEIYIFILKAGSCPARAIARKFGINRMKAYRALKALERRGLVQSTLERPVKFAAAPLAKVLDNQIEQAKKKIPNLEESRLKIINYYQKISTAIKRPEEETRFRIVQGRQQVYDLFLKMCQGAQEQIRLITTTNDLHRLSLAGVDDEIRHLRKKPLNTLILTQINQTAPQNLGNYLNFAEVRHMLLPATVRFVVIDESEVLTTFAMDDSMSITTQGDTGLWTNASDFVMAIKTFFDAVWTTAPNAHEVLEAAKHGTIPQEIKLIRTQEEYAETYRNMTDSNKGELLILANSLDSTPLLRENLKAILTSSMNIRLLTQVRLDNLPNLKAMSPTIQIAHETSATDLCLLVTDRKETLLQIPYPEGKNQSIWSNLKTYVDTMTQIFENYWKDAIPLKKILPRLTTQQTLTESLQLAKQRLEPNGWTVELPGKLMGESMTVHTFSLVAKRAQKTLTIDLLIDEPPLNQLIMLYAKAMDVKPTTQILVSINPLGTREQNTAQQYGIKVIYGTDAQQLSSKIIEEADAEV